MGPKNRMAGFVLASPQELTAAGSRRYQTRGYLAELGAPVP